LSPGIAVVASFGIPLLDDGRPVAGLSVALPTSRLTPGRQAEIVAALLEARDGRASSKAASKELHDARGLPAFFTRGTISSGAPQRAVGDLD
jgi:hypothetical protein